MAAIYATMSEREFQGYVLGALTERGWHWWHVHDSRKMTAGLPDILAVKPGAPTLIAWELKGPKTPITPMQEIVIKILQGVPGIDARVIRPSQWPAVLEELDR